MDFEIKSFSQQLRKLREDKGISQEQLANASGITRRYVILMEKGEVNFGVAKLDKYLTCLDIDLRKLISNSQVL